MDQIECAWKELQCEVMGRIEENEKKDMLVELIDLQLNMNK